MNEIAIIGMAGRFPGSRNLNELWSNLCAGKNAVSFFTDKELAAQGVSREVINNPNYVKAGSILDGIEEFDAGFFGYSPKEAEITDPQHRLLLECAWEALENAGCVPDRFEGDIGVFVAGSLSTYLLFNLLTGIGFSGPVDNIPTLIGNDKDYLATRLSYKLNLKGPSINIQTACSSSLVAVHMACQSLLNGECDAVLAGGVTIRVPHRVGYFYQEGGYLSPDGRCKAFAQKANGTIFGNGVGVVVLKRLSDALAAGDRIEAVIKGSAVNNDGATKVGFTAPSIEGQVRVISEALAVADISPETISYVEAHGTGTPLGDPIEIAALSEVFRAATDRKQFCAIGSIKTNLGHLESAAGAAGLIKAVLALKHKVLPPSLNCDSPNERIDFPNTPFYVNTGLQKWEATSYPRRSAVSSFGIGGTNAHVILEEHVVSSVASSLTVSRTEKTRILNLSAHNQEALREQASNYRDWFRQNNKTKPLFEDVCYTASQRRKRHAHRMAIVAANETECIEKLDAFLQNEATQGLFSGRVNEKSASAKLVLVFSGQGAQWWGMGRQFLRDEPVFRQMMEVCDGEVKDFAGWSVLDEFKADEQISKLDGDNIEITQVSLFCLQVSLAALWESFGIQPAAVIGHSMGEVAAAFVAGALSLSDAVKIIVTRSRLLQSATGIGAMAAIELPVAEIERQLTDYRDSLGVAACNSSSSTVVSGEAGALNQLVSSLEGQDIVCRLLRTTGVAGHSPQVELQREQLVAALIGNLRPRTNLLPMVSTNTGRFIDGQNLDADYWGRNLREPVLFADGIKELIKTGHTIFLEISPHPILSGAVARCLEDAGISDYLLLHSLRRAEEERTFLSALAQLSVFGYSWNEEKLFPAGGCRCIELPAYAWQRERYWIEPDLNGANSFANALQAEKGQSGKSSDSVIGWTESSIDPGNYFSENWLDVKTQPWLADHVVAGEIVVPAALYLDWACQAGAMLFPETGFALEKFTFLQPLLLSSETGSKVQIAVKPLPDKGFAVRISSFVPGRSDKDRWVCHAQGYLAEDISRSEISDKPTPPDQETLRKRDNLKGNRFYSRLAHEWLQYGENFRVLEQVWFNTDEVFAQMRSDALERDFLQPKTLTVFQLDGLLQTFLPLCGMVREIGEDGEPVLPVSFDRMTVNIHRGQPLWAFAQLKGAMVSHQKTSFWADLSLIDKNGQSIAEITGLEVRPLESQSSLAKLQAIKHLLHQVTWQKRNSQTIDPAEQIQGQSRHWLIMTDRGEIGEQLRGKLEAQGQTCEMLRSDDWIGDAGELKLSDALRSIISRQLDNLRGVVHLWNLDQPEVEPSLQFPLEETQRLSCNSVTALFQALSAAGKSKRNPPPRLWFITKGCQPVDGKFSGSSTMVSQALTWGIVRAARYEHPEYAPAMCDLSFTPTQSEIEKLFDEIWFNSSEPELAFRHDESYVARLTRPYTTINGDIVFAAAAKTSACSAAREMSDSPSLKREPDFNLTTIRYLPDATYLITGGLGGLGLATAASMVAHGANHVLLIGRSKPSEAASRIIDDLQKSGATIKAIAADVSDVQAMSALLAQIKRELPPLKGIVCAAGVLSDGLIEYIEPVQMRQVLTPKVLGSWNLHCLTLDAQLDFFVLYSSVASMVGSPGQASHAAANSFLDALAHYREAQNLPASSINWGPWEIVGKAADAAISQALTGRGLRSISPAAALDILNRLLANKITQAGVFFLDLQKWTEYYPQLKNSAFFNSFETAPESEQKLARSEDDLRAKLLSAPAGQRRAMLANHIRNQAARVLGMDSKLLDPKVPLQNYGLDSLRALEFRNVLEKITDSKISAVICWKYPTVDELSNYLGMLIDLPFDELQTTLPKIENLQVEETSVTDLLRLSEAETVGLLLQKLEAIE